MAISGDARAPSAGKIRHKRGGVSHAALDQAPLEGFSPSLDWSRCRALMKVEPAMVRTFFEIEAERGRWQVEHLEPQIHTQPRGVVGLLGKAVRRDGAIIVSDALDPEARVVLGLDRPLYVRGLADGHRGYLPWHRERVFDRRPEADRQGKPPTAAPHAHTLDPEGT